MSKAAEILLVHVSCPPAQAEPLAVALVEARVAACVSIVPAIRSVYRWQGAVQRDDEALLLIKTAAARFEALKAEVLKHHPYELPEIVAVNPVHGHAPYFDWVVESST